MIAKRGRGFHLQKMKCVKRKNVEADMEDVGLFLRKNKGRACFFCCQRSQMMYTTIECLSVCDWEKELRFTRQGNVCCFLCRAT